MAGKGFLSSFMNFVSNDDLPEVSEECVLSSDANNVQPNKSFLSEYYNSNKIEGLKRVSVTTDAFDSKGLINKSQDSSSNKNSNRKARVTKKRKKKIEFSDDDIDDDAELEQSDEEWSSRKIININNKSHKSIRTSAKKVVKINNLQISSNGEESIEISESQNDPAYTTESNKKQQSFLKNNSNKDETTKKIEAYTAHTQQIIKSNPLLCPQKLSNNFKTPGNNFKNYFMPNANFIFELNWIDPHFYKKGTFVVEKKEYLFNPNGFPLWHLDCGKLLEKYEQLPIAEDDKRLFARSSTYSSWSDSIKSKYKAVAAVKVNDQKFELLPQFCPKPNSLSVDISFKPLAFAFNVYVQTFLSQSLESTFLQALVEEPDDYYTDSLTKIDNEFNTEWKKIKEKINWTPDFQVCVETFSKCVFIDSNRPTASICQATNMEISKNSFCVRFYGYKYDRTTLKLLGEIEESKGQEFVVGDAVADIIPIYHVLYHIRLFFYSMCHDKVVKTLKEAGEDDDEKILDLCLQNSSWMQQMFFHFTQILIRSRKLIETIII